MTTTYRASSNVTITLASLAASTTLVQGRCSAAVANGTNQDDFILPMLRTRSGGTITAGGAIELWAFAQRADATWPELFTAAYTGNDGSFTVNNRDALFAGAVLLGSASQSDTTARNYVIRGRELSQAFGAVPQNFAFFVVHNLGASGILDATAGNHVLTTNAGKFA